MTTAARLHWGERGRPSRASFSPPSSTILHACTHIPSLRLIFPLLPLVLFFSQSPFPHLPRVAPMSPPSALSYISALRTRLGRVWFVFSSFPWGFPSHFILLFIVDLSLADVRCPCGALHRFSPNGVTKRHFRRLFRDVVRDAFRDAFEMSLETFLETLSRLFPDEILLGNPESVMCGCVFSPALCNDCERNDCHSNALPVPVDGRSLRRIWSDRARSVCSPFVWGDR